MKNKDALPAFCLQEAEFYLKRLEAPYYTEQDIKDCADQLFEQSESWINSDVSQHICEKVYVENHGEGVLTPSKPDNSLPEYFNMRDMCYCTAQCQTKCARKQTPKESIYTASDFTAECSMFKPI